MRYDEILDSLKEYYETYVLSYTENEPPLNFSETSEALDDFDSSSVVSSYESANACRTRVLFKEQLDSIATLKRASFSRKKSRLDFILEEANNLRAIQGRLTIKNEFLGDTGGGDLGEGNG